MLTQTYLPTDNPAVTLTAYQFNRFDESDRPDLRPAVLVFPGGGYNMCSDREADPIAFAFLNAGFHAFVLRYTVGPEVPFPRPLLDAFAAMRFLREHAAELAVQPDKIAVCGFSAGGHLTASLGTLWNHEKLLAQAGCTAKQVRPDALILGYPAISGMGRISGRLASLIGDGDPDEVLALLEVQNHVDAQTPPTFLFHTYGDEIVPVENSLLFAAALAKANVPFEMHVYTHGLHGLALSTKTTSVDTDRWVDADAASWIPHATAWLHRMFANTDAPIRRAVYPADQPFFG